MIRRIILFSIFALTPFTHSLWASEGVGLEKHLEEHEGKVVFVDFWASWCSPCRASFPFMQDMTQKYGDELVVIAVNLDKSRSDAEKFLSEFEVNFNIVYDPDGDLAKSIDLKGMPTSYLYDRAANLVGSHVGFKKKDINMLDQAIADAISR